MLAIKLGNSVNVCLLIETGLLESVITFPWQNPRFLRKTKLIIQETNPSKNKLTVQEILMYPWACLKFLNTVKNLKPIFFIGSG
jgi:hypothetical protein